MVADDNRRASDNLATRDYPSLQVIMRMENVMNVNMQLTDTERSEALGYCLLTNILVKREQDH